MNIRILDDVLCEVFPKIFEKREIAIGLDASIDDSMYSSELGFLCGARLISSTSKSYEIKVYVNGVFERNMEMECFRNFFEPYHKPFIDFLESVYIKFDADVYSIMSVLEVLSLINDDIMSTELGIEKKYDVIVDNNIDLTFMAFQNSDERYRLAASGFNYGYELYVQGLRGLKFMLTNFIRVYNLYKDKESNIVVGTGNISSSARIGDGVVISVLGTQTELVINDIRDNGVCCVSINGEEKFIRWYQIIRLVQREKKRDAIWIFSSHHSTEYMMCHTNMFDVATIKNSNGIFTGRITYITRRGINVKTSVDEHFYKWCDVVSIKKVVGDEWK